MKHDFHHGKVLSFHRSGEELRSKASWAEKDDDVLHALQLYRTALEQDQDDLLTGIAYARLLWENGCWRSSLRECWRLLGRYPKRKSSTASSTATCWRWGRTAPPALPTSGICCTCTIIPIRA